MNQHVRINSLSTCATERLRCLAAHLREVPSSKFDMNLWGPDMDVAATWGWDQLFHLHDCGAPACIAGHTINLFREAASEFSPDRTVYGIARDILDIPNETADILFAPGDDDGHYAATPRQAARVVDHLADTGNVDWSIIKQELV